MNAPCVWACSRAPQVGGVDEAHARHEAAVLHQGARARLLRAEGCARRAVVITKGSDRGVSIRFVFVAGRVHTHSSDRKRRSLSQPERTKHYEQNERHITACKNTHHAARRIRRGLHRSDVAARRRLPVVRVKRGRPGRVGRPADGTAEGGFSSGITLGSHHKQRAGAGTHALVGPWNTKRADVVANVCVASRVQKRARQCDALGCFSGRRGTTRAATHLLHGHVELRMADARPRVAARE